MADINDVYRFFKSESPTFFLATEEGGQPRVRPFGTVDLFEGRLYCVPSSRFEPAASLFSEPLRHDS